MRSKAQAEHSSASIFLTHLLTSHPALLQKCLRYGAKRDEDVQQEAYDALRAELWDCWGWSSGFAPLQPLATYEQRFTQMMDFSFVGNSQKVREATCVAAKPREANSRSPVTLTQAKPLCEATSWLVCVMCFQSDCRRLWEDDLKTNGRAPCVSGPALLETMERFREAFAKLPRSVREATAKPPLSNFHAPPL